jgi:pilus assembly protein CpaF
MRPDRIIVGECRGGETLDMLQAMNTGHDGSLTTVHANSPRDVISRLEVMTLLGGIDIPITAIREQVASAVDVIVQQMRLADGSRRITHIVEVTGMENGTVQLQQLFRYERVGFDANGRVVGYFTGCNAIPTFYEELRAVGVDLDLKVFTPVEREDQSDERRA